jgi:enoyl-CoA hydratase/carnithine racemase
MTLVEQEIVQHHLPAGIALRRDGDIALLELDDGRGNALGTAGLQALHGAIAEARSADAVLLSGRPRIFCGGLDLEEIASMPRNRLIEFFDLLHMTRRALFALERPLVVAVAGSAIGAGASLLCCGDRRLGARDSGIVGFTEAKLGVPLPASAMAIAASALAPSITARALVFGEVFDRQEALQYGFFHQLTDPERLLEEARQAVHGAARTSRASGLIKRTLRKEAIERMDRERAESHAIFAAEWTSAAAQALIQGALKNLRAPR